MFSGIRHVYDNHHKHKHQHFDHRDIDNYRHGNVNYCPCGSIYWW